MNTKVIKEYFKKKTKNLVLNLINLHQKKSAALIKLQVVRGLKTKANKHHRLSCPLEDDCIQEKHQKAVKKSKCFDFSINCTKKNQIDLMFVLSFYFLP